MEGIKINEVFCEILSGFSILVCLIAFFDITGISCIKQSLSVIITQMNVATFGAVIVASYLWGLLMDVIGMAADDYIFEPLLCKDLTPPNESETNEFWKNVPLHVLSYRDTQWAYYSAYRNLSIIVIVGGILWAWSIKNNYGWWYSIFLIVVLVLFEFALLKTMKALLVIYIKITKIQYQIDHET